LIQDTGADLNGALQCGRDWCTRRSSGPILVLAADLPFLTAAELNHFICAGLEAGVGIATDRAGQGTNALLLSEPSIFEFRFGPDSRAGHEAEALRLGVRPIVRQTPGLAMDVDEPEDLNRICGAARIPFQGGKNTW
jgi:2-phospho-L-lactate guanylyltransferase